MKQRLSIVVPLASVAACAWFTPALEAGYKVPRVGPPAKVPPFRGASYVAGALALEADKHRKQVDAKRATEITRAALCAVLLGKELRALVASVETVAASKQVSRTSEESRQLLVEEGRLSTQRQQIELRLSALWLQHTSVTEERVKQRLLEQAAELRQNADELRRLLIELRERELRNTSPKE